MISIALAAVLITKIKNGLDVPHEDLQMFLATGMMDVGLIAILVAAIFTK